VRAFRPQHSHPSGEYEKKVQAGAAYRDTSQGSSTIKHKEKTMAPVSVHNYNHEAVATVTVAVQATTFETTFNHMTSTLGYDAIYLLDYLIDETTFDTLNLMGYSPPIVQSLEGQTKILSQRINRDNGTLTMQISRILYVTVPVTDKDSETYNIRLVPDAPTVDVATLSIFTHQDRRIGLVTKLRTAMPEIFGRLETASFDNFIAKRAEFEDNPIVIYRDTGHAIGGHHYAANDPDAAFFSPSAEPSFFPSNGAPPTFLPSTAPTNHPTTQSSETKVVAVSVLGSTFDIKLDGMTGELDMSDFDILMDVLDTLVKQTLNLLKPNLSLVADVSFLSQVIDQSFRVGIHNNNSKRTLKGGRKLGEVTWEHNGGSRFLKGDADAQSTQAITSIVGIDEEETKKEKKTLSKEKKLGKDSLPAPPIKTNPKEKGTDQKPIEEDELGNKGKDKKTGGSGMLSAPKPSKDDGMPGIQQSQNTSPNNRLKGVKEKGGGQSEVIPTPPMALPTLRSSTPTSQPTSMLSTPPPIRLSDPQLGTLTLRISRTVFFRVPESYDKSLLPDASIVDVATVSIFARPDHFTWDTLRHSEMTDAFRNLEGGKFLDFVYNETPSVEIWERPPLEGGAETIGVDSSGKYVRGPETSGEIWEEPGNNSDDSEKKVLSAIDAPGECNTKSFVGQGGVSMEVVYRYDLLSRNGADVQGDAIELDQMIPKFLQNLFMLTCEEEDDLFALGGLSSQRSIGGEVEGLFWINRGYLDAQDRSGVCTSREGMTAGDYNLGCTPMVGAISVFLMPSADAEKVKTKVLQSIQMASFETTGKSWAVYVGEYPKGDLSSTNIVAGATESSWAEQTVGHLTIKSILIYGAVAVFAALGIVVLAVIFNNIKRKRRNRVETQKFEQLQNKRRARVKAKRNAMANKRFAEKQRAEASDDLPVEMGYEAEPVVSAVVVHSMITEEGGTNEQADETAPVVFDRQEAIVLSPTGVTNASSFSFD